MKKNTISILLLITLVSTQLLAKNTKTAEFKTFKFSIEKPDDWFDITVENYAEQLNQIKTLDEDFNELIKKHAKIPFFAITKYKEPHDDLNPSLKINIKPAGNLDLSKPELIVKALLSFMETKFSNFKIIEEPKLIKINGQQAGYARFSYTLKVDDDVSFDTSSALWILPHNGQFFLIGAGYRSDEKNGKFEEIKKIVNSIILY
ncbi:MAG: hypothetical protein O9301_09760 [Leptospira sp.]|nr:hypothetical protein [Leptospira sp.]